MPTASQREKRTTAADVARLAGVQRSAVSVVLNGARSSVGISVEARRRIHEAAAQLKYRPSAPARALVSGRSMQLAVLTEIADLESGIGRRYPNLRGLLEAAERSNYRVVVVPLRAGEVGERQLESLIEERACDGLCLVADQLESSHLNVLKRRRLPCVVIGDRFNEKLDEESKAGVVRVDLDNLKYAADSVAYLAGRGHRGIALVTTSGEKPELPHVQAVHRGYRTAMEERGLAPLVLPCNAMADLAGRIRCGQVTAVISRSLHGVVHVQRSLLEEGLSLPQDVTVLALVEESDFATLLTFGRARQLSYHLYRHRLLGETAGDILLRWAAGSAPDRSLFLLPAGPIGEADEVLAALESPAAPETRKSQTAG